MKRTHAITGSPGTYWHMLVLLPLTVLFTFSVPFAGEQLFDFLAVHAVNIGILYAIVVGFVMSLTLARRQNIDESVAIELNKIRRIYHLALHLSKAGGGAAEQWFLDVERGIKGYLDAFRKMDFAGYASANGRFRKLTYAIYELPQRHQGYDAELYGALLDATGSATEAREHIRAQKDAGIGRFQWWSLLFITVVFGAIISAATQHDPFPRALSAVVNISLVLMLQLVYEHDHFNPRKRRALAELYVRDWELIRNPEIRE